MTDPKKPRQPRQITLGLAIDRLLAIRAAGETAATKAATRARARYVARWDALMASVPEHLLPAVRSALAASAGSIEEAAFAGAGDDDTEQTAPVIPEGGATVPAAELRGTAEYVPGPAARAATGRGR